MKKLFFLITFLLIGFLSWGQKSKRKLSEAESANLTQEQRLTHETDRKTKGGKKKNLTMEKKIKAAKKMDKKARKTKAPKTKKRKPHG